ncbi:protein of unknown function [Micropruina glycogenica]|uniref:Uncharacterized protein n=1 Tax=Micropruina glycogenica TaxID=75385 RepID=A0A2N9JE30_9ACTN|nr:protein of unknown function [Micropruina glycogenica]
MMSAPISDACSPDQVSRASLKLSLSQASPGSRAISGGSCGGLTRGGSTGVIAVSARLIGPVDMCAHGLDKLDQRVEIPAFAGMTRGAGVGRRAAVTRRTGMRGPPSSRA